MIRDNEALAARITAETIELFDLTKPVHIDEMVSLAVAAALEARDDADQRYFEAVRLRRDRHTRRPWAV